MRQDRIRVLFVDDEEGNLKAFRATFRRDWEVFVADSGEAGLKLLEQEAVHVVISDQRMPGMTGDLFLAAVKERYPETMRMLLTGYADLEAVVAAVNQGGIYAYGTKPWDANDLKLRVEQAYDIQQLRAEKDSLLERYRQLFEASGDPIVLVEERGRILEANHAAAKLLGVPLSSLTGMRFTKHVVNARDLIRNLKERRQGDHYINVDLTLRNERGDLIDCLLTATALAPQADGTRVYQAMIKDVTDRMQEEKKLRRLNSDLDKRVAVRTRQLLEALEDLGSFSYSVAHDLRSPLKNIAALTDHLHHLATERDDQEARAFTERIAKGAARMIDLVDDLLRFSQTNTRELEPAPVNLKHLVEQAIGDQVPDERRAQVHLDITPDTEVLADAPMIKVVLHNLLSNALKFSRTQDAPRIVVAHRDELQRDVISVSDNGVGFDPQHRDQVFGAFKRLHQADQFEGTGVGLAIVHRIVSKHGGQVWAESSPGQGTTIHFALPRTHAVSSGLPFAMAG